MSNAEHSTSAVRWLASSLIAMVLGTLTALSAGVMKHEGQLGAIDQAQKAEQRERDRDRRQLDRMESKIDHIEERMAK